MATAPPDQPPSTDERIGEEVDPFSMQDLKHVLDEEKNSSETEGWRLVKNTDLAEIWKKSEDGTPVNLIKGFLRFPGIPPADVFELVSNLDVRRRWEKQFPVMEIIEEHEKYKVVYWRVQMPVGVVNRDLVQKVTYRRDEEKKLIYILYKNATHASRPEEPGFVRAETILSATLIRPEENDPNSTKLTIMLQNDPKGWIPKFIVNMFAAKAPGDWRDSLANFYHNVYKKEKEDQPEEKEQVIKEEEKEQVIKEEEKEHVIKEEEKEQVIKEDVETNEGSEKTEEQ